MKKSSVLMIFGAIAVLALPRILFESTESKCDNGDQEACTLLEEQAKKDEERRWEAAREAGESEGVDFVRTGFGWWLRKA